jgi:hypothetical protein
MNNSAAPRRFCLRQFALIAAGLLLAGCAQRPAVDYSAILEARPATILVLPPLNDTTEVSGTPGVWALATRPLSEAGYYVLPVTLVDETFRQNGLNMAGEINEVPLTRLREVFGADAVLYLRIRKYGTAYKVIVSETRVELEGRLVDLRNGRLLWKGASFASSGEGGGGGQGGLVGMLVTALVKQIAGTLSDASFKYAAIADDRLLGAPRPRGLPTGPRSPEPWKVPVDPR